MKFLSLLAAVGALTASAAGAAVIVDQSPDVTGVTYDFTTSNIAQSQNWLVKFTLGATTTIGGFDIYSDIADYFGTGPTAFIGAPTIVKIRSDVAGAPAATNSFAYSTQISAEDSVGSSANPSLQRLHADFAATTLAVGDYWIGMGGDNNEIGWTQGGSAPRVTWILLDDSLLSAVNGSFAFRVDSVASSTPEPATWALMIGGFGLVGGALRRGRAVAPVAG